ncbi:Zinc finger and BTB domain-containing protein 41 [Homalodisca vitripennis]|nr:Zinc finger and BTB domain-containing protein 41 [Homalodisca vitripennis]
MTTALTFLSSVTIKYFKNVGLARLVVTAGNKFGNVAQLSLAAPREEVIIEDGDVPAWTQDVEMEDDASADVTMESTASESTVSSAVAVNPMTGEVKATSETIETLVESELEPQAEPQIEPDPEPELHPIQPIVTSVTSLAKPMAKIVNLNNFKLLPRGSFVNIGNKKMKLVTLTGDKKLIAGKVVTVTNADNKVITGKVVSLGTEKKMIPAKVVSVSGNNTASGGIINNKVVPAKVVSIANSKLKPISAGNNKEVTIYITGLAGDKVQIRDSGQLTTKLQIGSKVHVVQLEHPPYSPDLAPSDFHLFRYLKEFLGGKRFDTDDEKEAAEADTWKSDHIDACLPLDPSVEESEMITPDTEAAEGHFLLEGAQNFDGVNLTCHICERQFTQLKYLLSHQQTHILSEPVSCDQCDKHFKRRYDLLRHKRRSHADNAVYECDICHKTFNDRTVASKHRLIHTDDFKYCCEVCNRPFKYVHDLKRHRSIHFDEKPFDCEICGKKFKHKSNLKTHQATHYSTKPYSCTLCDKRFHQKGNLKTHLIVHTGEMPFVCNICTKRFHTRSGLLNHSYSHSDEKPFQCDICEKAFNWKSGLLTHQQTHRPRIVPEEVQVIEIGPIPVDN